MFFCLNLVFATSTTSNARVIKGNDVLDITVNLKNNEYVLTNAVIDPFTKSNIPTYIVKENVPISFNLINSHMEPRQALLKNFYYYAVNNKNVKIRCIDKLYYGGTDIQIIPEYSYSILKATNRLNNCLFIFDLDYKLNENSTIIEKNIQFAFKIVSEKEYNMYKDMETAKDPKDIFRPKKSNK